MSKANYGTLEIKVDKNRHMSTKKHRDATPTSSIFQHETASNQAYKEIKERKKNELWDAITKKDFEKFKREEDQKQMRRREEQEQMRNFLENQMKEVELKKTMAQRKERNEHEQIISQLKQYDKQVNNLHYTKRKLLEDQKKQNIDLLKRRKEQQYFDKAQSLLTEKIYNKDAVKQVKELEQKQLFNVSKQREDRQRDLVGDLSHYQIQKSSIKALTKMDHMSQMNNEFDLFSKNQERYKQKIKDLVQRNESIYNNYQSSPYKNLSVAEQERDRKLKVEANESFMQELKRKNKLMDEMNQKKSKELFYLKQIQQKQIDDKMVKKKQSNTNELMNDRIMLDTLNQYENQMTEKERMQEINRRNLCRQNLEETKNASMSLDPNFTREFELNKSLLKEASHNNSILF